jgi:hypothetical protein
MFLDEWNFERYIQMFLVIEIILGVFRYIEIYLDYRFKIGRTGD